MALRRHQVRVKKLNASEPLKTCRKELNVDKTVRGGTSDRITAADNCLLAADQPA